VNGLALVRIDHFGERGGASPFDRVSLKAVFADTAIAKSELARLRDLHAHLDVEWVMLPAFWEAELPARGGFALLGVRRAESTRMQPDQVVLGGAFVDEAAACAALAARQPGEPIDWHVVVARYRPELVTAPK
jgi:hypothetical protein